MAGSRCRLSITQCVLEPHVAHQPSERAQVPFSEGKSRAQSKGLVSRGQNLTASQWLEQPPGLILYCSMCPLWPSFLARVGGLSKGRGPARISPQTQALRFFP